MRAKFKSFVPTLVLTTLVAGTLDIADAFLFSSLHGVSPKRVLLFIAFAILGRTAFAGGLATAALGLLLHYLVTLIWAALFFITVIRMPDLRSAAPVAGPLYGLLIYFFMNDVVLGLTRVPHQPAPHFAAFLNGILALMLLVGLPIALFSRRLVLSD